MISKFLPKTHNIYRGIAKFGLGRIKNSSGADVVGMIPREGGKIDPQPMKLKRRDEDNSQYWSTLETDEEFDVGPQGLSYEYIGNTPVAFFTHDPPRETSLLEARIRDAIDLGDHDAVYTDADIELHEHIQMPDEAVSENGAMADGGVMGQVEDRTWEVETDHLPEDHIIDVGGAKDAVPEQEEVECPDCGENVTVDMRLERVVDGMRVSWRRVNDILHQNVPTEEMNMQEQRGELAGAAGNDDKIMRVVIYALVAIVGVVFIFFLGPAVVKGIFGSGVFEGGGGGGTLPGLGG